MPLDVRRELKLGELRVQIEPESYPEEEFVAQISFTKDREDSHMPDYMLTFSLEEWQNLKDLVDETFRHMQTYVDRLPKEDEDEE